jgi:spermidine/putrescine transport system permease protein
MIVPGSTENIARYSLTAVTCFVFLILYLPIITLVIFSFTASRFPFFPITEWSVKWYVALWHDQTFFASFRNSLLVSGSASIVSVIFGFFGSYSLVRAKFIGKGVISSLLVLPLAVPLVLLALALRIYFAALGFDFNLITVFLGHLVYMIPLSVMVLRGRFESFPWSHEEAGLDLGASRMRIFLEIIVPWMLPAIVGALLLNFTFSFDEFIVAWFLTNFQITLPIKIWTDLLMMYNPKVNVIGTIVFILSITVALTAHFALRKK